MPNRFITVINLDDYLSPKFCQSCWTDLYKQAFPSDHSARQVANLACECSCHQEAIAQTSVATQHDQMIANEWFPPDGTILF